MGRVADWYGVRWTVMFGAVSVCIGLYISTLGQPWQLYVGHGLFMGLLGNAGLNAPLYVYVSRWFDRRRGSALALISSASYVAGALWPVAFERIIAAYGWRTSMLAYGVFELCVILPLAAIFLRTPPELALLRASAAGDHKTPKVFGWNPNVVFAMCLMPSAFAIETASASPRALNEPVGSRPSSLTRISPAASIRASFGIATIGVSASPRLTMSCVRRTGRSSR